MKQRMVLIGLVLVGLSSVAVSGATPAVAVIRTQGMTINWNDNVPAYRGGYVYLTSTTRVDVTGTPTADRAESARLENGYMWGCNPGCYNYGFPAQTVSLTAIQGDALGNTVTVSFVALDYLNAVHVFEFSMKRATETYVGVPSVNPWVDPDAVAAHLNAGDFLSRAYSPTGRVDGIGLDQAAPDSAYWYQTVSASVDA